MKRLALTLLTGLLLATAGSAMADEGMWTMNHLPIKQMQQKYGFTPSQQWIDHVQRAALRLAEGCSGSFVSANGLVMTNHHCANTCLSQLSDKNHNYMQDGYVAKDDKDEPKCPDMELNQLEKITDVTARVNAATAGKNGAARIKAQRAVDSAIEKACVNGDPDTWRCDVVTLYHGGRYALYKYRRYQDVRLVFAPEQSIAFFGGDPDNFNFPRYDLDVTFFRAYVNGKPAHTPDFFQFDPKGPKAGELTFVVGNPGSTQRQTPWTSLAYMRDKILVPLFGYLSEERGLLWQYSRMGKQQAKEAQDSLFGIDNSLKVYKGWLETLNNEAFVAKKKQEDASLRDWINADPARVKKFGHPWKMLDKAQQRGAQLRERYAMIERGQGFGSTLFSDARMLVRAAAERTKPDADRLPPYRDANLPAMQQRVEAKTPFYPQYDETKLAWTLEKMRQALGADDPFVHEVLGKKSPEQLAHELVYNSKLGDPAVRKQLWNGGEKAIAASHDPMIELARKIDPVARKLRKQYEDEVDAPMRKASEAIAQARFARDGASSYPDATFTMRLSYGTVKGWMEKGKEVPPFTHFAGLYKRATGADPFKLPESWLKAKSSLDLSTPMDFVTDNDIIGGNSGSPVINKEGHVVGLIFDGNIHSLGGNFTFDDSVNRAVAVDTAALDQALRKVYHLPRLAEELEKGHQ
ncbi:S46 family peptidase [Oleiagrimonas sp. MCCC 1A03011]|uniref:S46 family peptidase n=1 Tax=Oleiagrimonas sp. MCCC 1A03011 TaxID=1926883 RepID=UPI000DC5008D|nr:S46 family peptidase [Oleiagrimonas sp. MCCC 1A03011]RAP58113.1 peptidase S46 [Oleiagrimonas sp. MCCC 1A03011]